MDSYTIAHQLAQTLKQSEQYSDYHRMRELVMKDERNQQMLSEYKKKQMQIQAAYLAGEEPSREDMERLQGMTLVMQYNKEVSAYLVAEYRMNQLVGDIYKIIGDAVELDLSFMQK